MPTVLEEISDKKISTPSEPRFPPFLGWLGLIVLVPMVMLIATTPWEWSLLMDDVNYQQIVKASSGVGNEIITQIHNHWNAGRFHPTKNIWQLIRWTFLSPNPTVAHWINFGLFLATMAMTALAFIPKKIKADNSSLYYFLFFVGFGVLQRPLLDMIALNTIPEPLLALFFAAGLFLYSRQMEKSARLVFLLVALSKEIGIVIFLALGLVNLIEMRGSVAAHKIKKWWIWDFLLFFGLVYVMNRAKHAGAYASGYSLLSTNLLHLGVRGLVKVGLGLIPIIFLMFVAGKKYFIELFHQLQRGQMKVSLLCLFFGLGYLYLGSAWKPIGYILIPASLACAAFAASLMPGLLPTLRSPLVKGVFVVLFMTIFTQSLYRYDRYVKSINETTVAFKHLFLTATPRLIITRGAETISLATVFHKEFNTPVTIEGWDQLDETMIRNWNGDVVLLELTTYYGPTPEKIKNKIGDLVGGWKKEVNQGVYRIYYSNKGSHV